MNNNYILNRQLNAIERASPTFLQPYSTDVFNIGSRLSNCGGSLDGPIWLALPTDQGHNHAFKYIRRGSSLADIGAVVQRFYDNYIDRSLSGHFRLENEALGSHPYIIRFQVDYEVAREQYPVLPCLRIDTD